MWITRTHGWRDSPTLAYVDWDGLFDDLEDQLASGWEAERAALEAESERVRIARLTLKERLSELARREAEISATLEDGTVITGVVHGVGADWAALVMTNSAPAWGSVLKVVPLAGDVIWHMRHGELLSSMRSTGTASAVRDRMTLGFVLRDLARRRCALTLRLRTGLVLTGTVDRAGADHLDLALHDLSEPRRANAVRGFRVVPLTAIAALSTTAQAIAPLL
ncbi:hypothetical protein [Microbacterium sp. YY-01]|uniref:hypothetical protein n=1 Tax=Microbacterium sp. YY-01 TaxID=3421634 RepID=UPI003D17BC64